MSALVTYKKRKYKFMVIILLILLTPIILYISIISVNYALSIFNPLRRSPESIRNHILELTPLGSSSEQVKIAIEDKFGITVSIISAGFSRTEENPSPPPRNRIISVGETHIRANIGHYFMPFRTDVGFFWGFDKEGYLIDIDVRKFVDSF